MVSPLDDYLLNKLKANREEKNKIEKLKQYLGEAVWLFRHQGKLYIEADGVIYDLDGQPELFIDKPDKLFFEKRTYFRNKVKQIRERRWRNADPDKQENRLKVRKMQLETLREKMVIK